MRQKSISFYKIMLVVCITGLFFACDDENDDNSAIAGRFSFNVTGDLTDEFSGSDAVYVIIDNYQGMDDGQFLNITLSNTNPNKIMILSVVDSVAITTKTYQVQVNDEMGAYGSYAKGIDRSYISYSGELTIEKLNAEIIEGTLNMDFKSSDSESSISFEGTFTALSGYNVP